MAREFRTAGVVGPGTMGAGIDEVSSAWAVERGKPTEDGAAELLGRITTATTPLADLAEVDLVVGAILEHLVTAGWLDPKIGHGFRDYAAR